VKTDIWPDDTSMLEMSGWLAELRDDGDGEGQAGRQAGPSDTRGSQPEPAAAALNRRLSQVEIFAAEARARAQAFARVQASARAGAMARAGSRGRAQITARAVIGDELRMPIVWCEMGSCISWHSDPAALGEADIRARAIAADWRVDALGRLACPRCQQSDGRFWATHPVELRDRDTAMTASKAAAGRTATAGAAGRAEAGMILAVEPPLASLPAQERKGARLAARPCLLGDQVPGGGQRCQFLRHRHPAAIPAIC
jgi:hypothetical protein